MSATTPERVEKFIVWSVEGYQVSSECQTNEFIIFDNGTSSRIVGCYLEKQSDEKIVELFEALQQR